MTLKYRNGVPGLVPRPNRQAGWRARWSRLGVLLGLLALIGILVGGTYAPHTYSNERFTADGPDCTRCVTPPGNCVPNCCSSYTDIYVTNVRVVDNTSLGTTANFSWSDSLSSATDFFDYWVIGVVHNYTATPSGHAVHLTSLSSYVSYGFIITAWKNNNYPTCYISGTYSSTFSPYYPHYATLTTHIFNGSASLKIGGGTFGNGALGRIYIPDTVSLSAVIPTGWSRLDGSFGYWYTSLGSVASKFAPTTTIAFWSTNTTGDLNMVLNRTNSTWGGLVVSAANVSSVAAEFVVPAFKWAGPSNGGGSGTDACTNKPVPGEVLAIWEGIGFAGDALGPEGWLWQAGIDLWLNSSTSAPWVRVFAEESPAGFTPECPVYADANDYFPSNDGIPGVAANPLTYQPQVGDTIDVYLSVGHCAISGGYTCGNLTIKITHNGASAYWPSSSPGESYPLPTPTDQTTAEWIEENPSVTSPFQMPSVAPVNFTKMAYNQAYGSASYVVWQQPYGSYTEETPNSSLINISGHLVQQALFLAPIPTYLGTAAVARIQYETI